jgi:hypothetical protein
MRQTFMMVVAGAVAFPLWAVAQSAPKPPLLTSEANRDYFLVGNDLWSAASDQLVMKEFSKTYKPRLVAGRPDLVVYGGHTGTNWGLAQTAYVGTSAGQLRSVQLRVCAPPNACADVSPQNQTGVGPYLSKDLRRVVYLQAGDVWRGEVDWMTGNVVNQRQVTKVGVLGNPSIQRWPAVVHWYANTLYLRADLSQERPMLKVDLGTGAIEELEIIDVFEPGTFANPAGYRLCKSLTELLTCLDVRTGKTTRVGLRSVVGPEAVPTIFVSSRRADPGRDTPENTFWIDDETAVSVASNLHVVRVDFRAGRAETAYRHAKIEGSLRGASLLPGGRYLSVEYWERPTRDQTVRHLARIDLQDGTATPLPNDAIPTEMGDFIAGAWLDENRFVFSTRSGGLARIGTWIHDARTGESKRLCQVPAAIGGPRGPLGQGIAEFPHRKAVYFVANAPNIGVFKADMATGECRQIASSTSVQSAIVSVIDARPFDLRLNVTGNALW